MSKPFYPCPLQCRADLTARIVDRNGTLFCEVEENGQPVRDNLSYVWFENNTPIQNANDKTLKLADRWALFQSEQQYKCTVIYAKGGKQIERTSFPQPIQRKREFHRFMCITCFSSVIVY